jgi:hypothetical protein
MPSARGGGGIDKQKRAEDLSKDVSAFLNSDGGSLVCGIREDEGTEATGGAPVPLALFEPSVDGYARGDIAKEDIENIVTSNIQPKIGPNQYCITEVQHSGRVIFVIDVAKSMQGAYQAKDRKYYKRFHYKSEPMDHYELDGVWNRSIGPQLELIVGLSPTWAASVGIPQIGQSNQSIIPIHIGVQNFGKGVAETALLEMGFFQHNSPPSIASWVLYAEDRKIVIHDPKYGPLEDDCRWFQTRWHPQMHGQVYQPLFSMVDPTYVAKVDYTLHYPLSDGLNGYVMWRVQAPNMASKQMLVAINCHGKVRRTLTIERLVWPFEIKL